MISIHALLAESDGYRQAVTHCKEISIHALLAESDADERAHHQLAPISIHALLAESDVLNPFKTFIILIFLSTLSLRRATSNFTQKRHPLTISIHALLAESDTDGLFFFDRRNNFYPRSPCGERHISPPNLSSISDFYPRSPCGERHVACGYWHKLHHFYPRSPCGERRQPPHRHDCHQPISIHALLAESDVLASICAPPINIFLSTLSLRRATTSLVVIGTNCVISIHALLAESDL